jgi:hypothetical protein
VLPPGACPSGALALPTNLFSCLSIYPEENLVGGVGAGGRDVRDGLLICGCFLPQWRFVKPASALLLPLDIYFEEYLVGEGRAGGHVGSYPRIPNSLMHVAGAPNLSWPRRGLGEANESLQLPFDISRRESRWWSRGWGP